MPVQFTCQGRVWLRVKFLKIYFFIFEVLNIDYSQKKLQNSSVNRETNLTSLINLSLEVVYYSITVSI